VARKAILDATVRLLEHMTLQNLAIECIAREAGVGKATIYPWWPNKAAIVIDAFFEEVVPRTTFEQAPTAAEAIQRQAVRIMKVLNGRQGRIVAQIIAEGQNDPAVLEYFRSMFLRQRRARGHRSHPGGHRQRRVPGRPGHRTGDRPDLRSDVVPPARWPSTAGPCFR